MPKRWTVRGEMPRPWVVAGLRALTGVELFGEPGLGRRHDVVEGRGAVGAFAGAGIGGGDLHPGLGGELLDRVHERQAAVVGEEADRVAMRAAAEAMVEALLVVDGEGGRLFIVERAAGLPLAAGLGEFYMGGDDGREQGAGAQFVEELGGEAHGVSLSCEVGPVVGKCVPRLRSARTVSGLRSISSFVPSEVEGRSCGGRAKCETWAQSPAIRPCFLARDQGLICRSTSSASRRVWNVSDQTSCTGLRREVKSQKPPA